MLLHDIPIDVLIPLMVCIVFALCFHEFSHGYIAYRLGDNTAYLRGRLTMNPMKHLDPMGSLMLLFIGFGWAKPVPVNSYNLKNPRIDMIKVAAAGPISNLLLCVIACGLIRIFGPHLLLVYFALINMLLAVFNLLPIYPLDGGQIFGAIIRKYNPNIDNQLQIYAPKAFMIFIIINILLRETTGISILSYVLSPFYNLVTILAGL